MLTTYNAAEVSMIFSGIPISGLADGTFVSVEQNEDSFAVTVGSDGESVRTATNNRSGRVTFTLLQSSLSNDLLSALHNADKLTGDGIGPLLLKDNSGRTVIEAAKSWVVRSPTAEFAREASSREWIIETADLVQFHGGNATA